MSKSLQRKFRSVGRELNFIVASCLFLTASSILVAAFVGGAGLEVKKEAGVRGTAFGSNYSVVDPGTVDPHLANTEVLASGMQKTQQTAAEVRHSSPFLSEPTVTVHAAGRGKGLLNLQGGREFKAEYRGDAALSKALRTGGARPLALATGDFDADGAPDLVTGYYYSGAGILTLRRGNIDAFVPKDLKIYDRAAKGELPPSFLPEAQTLQLLEPPDFLLVGDFNNDGRKDVLSAARGGGLYLMVGDGSGGFSAPERLELPGGVTALTAGTFGHAEGWLAVIAGIVGPQGPALAVFNQDANGLSRTAKICPLSAKATALVPGLFDDDPYFDLGVAAGNEIIIVHGQKPAAPVSDGKPIDLPARMEHIDLGFNPRGLAAGTFVPDGVPRMDLAALSSDGTIHLLQRSTQKVPQAADVSEQPPGVSPYQVRDEMRKRFLEGVKASVLVPMWQPDKKQAWKEVRRLEVRIAPLEPDAPAALLTTSNVSARGADDLLLIDGAQKHVHVLVNDVSRQLVTGAGTDLLSRSSYTAVSLDTDAPVAVLPMPQKINGERDLMILSGGHSTAAQVPLVPNGVTLTVNTNSDLDRSPGSPNSQCNGIAGDCSLREAVLKTNVNAGPNTINVPGNIGTYNLSINNPNNPGGNGTIALPDLQIGSATNTNTTLIGISGTPKIVQTVAGNDVITTGFTTLPFPANAADVTLGLQNLEITGGTFTGIFTGADDGAGHTANTTITNCNVHNNTNGGSGASGTFGQGGGHQNQCGSLTIQGSTYANNSATNANTAQGGALYYSLVNPTGTCSAGDLTVTNSTFTSNTAAVMPGFPAGGAIIVLVPSLGTAVPISGSTFTSNLANGGGDGGALATSTSGRVVNVTKSTFTTNQASNASGRGGAIEDQSGPLNVNYCRFIGNTATTATNGKTFAQVGGTFNGNDNWWTQNTGPAANDVFGTVTLTTWLRFTHTASPGTINTPTGPAPHATTLTASFLTNSVGTPVSTSNLVTIIGLPISFSGATLGTLSGAQTTIQASGTATATFTAGSTGGNGGANATVENSTVMAPVIVHEPPTITSVNNATFKVGTNGSFTVTATGFPVPTFSETGALPGGVTLDPMTGVLSGNPAAGSGGVYNLTMTATNGVPPDSNQSFTLTVNEAPTITSASNTTFQTGVAGSFTVTTGHHFPVAETISKTGALPGGVMFVDNTDGTATLSGTPDPGTGGTYPITITAANGITPDATQSFTLTVNQPPAITSANSTTFTVGTNGNFQLTASGFPSTFTFSNTGNALPGGVTLSASGLLSGTPDPGYRWRVQSDL